MAKSMEMMGYGRVRYIPLITECRLNLVRISNPSLNVKNVAAMPIVFMIAQNHPATP
jgi:hypothetical protein